jgi:uncharacterized phiE125 gp8 family phage protein
MLCPLRIDVTPITSGSPAIVDRDLLKRHARIDFDDDDGLLDVYVAAAALWCENATNRTIFRRSCAWVLREFNIRRSPYDIRLPRGKASSVESIVYSAGGELTTMKGPSSATPGADYQEDLRSDAGGVLMPLRGSSWPSVDCDVPSPVVVNFTAGWPADEIPPDLIHAVIFGVADLYDMRGTADMNANALNAGGTRLATRNALISGHVLTPIY